MGCCSAGGSLQAGSYPGCALRIQPAALLITPARRSPPSPSSSLRSLQQPTCCRCPALQRSPSAVPLLLTDHLPIPDNADMLCIHLLLLSFVRTGFSPELRRLLLPSSSSSTSVPANLQTLLSVSLQPGSPQQRHPVFTPGSARLWLQARSLHYAICGQAAPWTTIHIARQGCHQGFLGPIQPNCLGPPLLTLITANLHPTTILPSYYRNMPHIIPWPLIIPKGITNTLGH